MAVPELVQPRQREIPKSKYTFLRMKTSSWAISGRRLHGLSPHLLCLSLHDIFLLGAM